MFRKATLARTGAGLAGGLMLCTAVAAHATPVISTTGISAPQNVITFEEIVLAGNTPMSNQYAGLGVTFGAGLFYDGNGTNSGGAFPNMSGHALANFDFLDGPFTTLFSIKFVDPVSAAAFAMVTNPGTSAFSAALLGGIEIESFTASTSTGSSTNFFGFEGFVFDEIRVSPGGSNNAMVLDNIQFNLAAVPEPATLAIFGLALVGLGHARRRKTAARSSALDGPLPRH